MKFDWFNSSHYFSHDSRMAKYWAAEEMAGTIYDETMLFNITWAKQYFPWLTQMLKKEWFR